jgi:hypothetical protein
VIKIHAINNVYADLVDLYGRIGGRAIASLTTQELTDGSFSEPFVRMNPAEAQELADSLWAAGIRPSQGKQSEGVTAAQARHLEDMRQLAFAKLNVEKPND